jgi:hypothetical protein
MFAPTNACNLRCDFCSRDASAPSRWDEASAFELLAGLARVGVLELALGGGEPLAFRGLDALLERLAAETSLAVHLTTNGVLLDERRLARLRPRVGEIRISIYDEQLCAIAAKLFDVEMEWLRVHARDAESAAQLARGLGPNAASGGRLVLLRAPRIGKRAGVHASRVGEGATILVGDELQLEAAYWSRRGHVDDLAPDDVERALRAELAGAAQLDGPVEIHWASLVVKLRTRTPVEVLPILGAFASSRGLEIHIEAQPTRPFERALGRLDVDVRALRRERRSR